MFCVTALLANKQLRNSKSPQLRIVAQSGLLRTALPLSTRFYWAAGIFPFPGCHERSVSSRVRGESWYWECKTEEGNIECWECVLICGVLMSWCPGVWCVIMLEWWLPSYLPTPVSGQSGWTSQEHEHWLAVTLTAAIRPPPAPSVTSLEHWLLLRPWLLLLQQLGERWDQTRVLAPHCLIITRHEEFQPAGISSNNRKVDDSGPGQWCKTTGSIPCQGRIGKKNIFSFKFW